MNNPFDTLFTVLRLSVSARAVSQAVMYLTVRGILRRFIVPVMLLYAIGSCQSITLESEPSKFPTSISSLVEFTPDKSWMKRFDTVLGAIAKDGTYNEPISLNSLADVAELYLVVFDSKKLDEPSAYNKNCRYISRLSLIVCDVRLFDEVLELFEFDKRQQTVTDEDGHVRKRFLVANTNEQLSIYRDIVVRWILAHEIGHHANRHQGEFLYIPDEPVGAKLDGARPIVQNYCQRYELEADAYLVENADKDWINSDLFPFLMEIVNREIIRASCPDQSVVSYCENVYPGVGLALSDELVLVEGSRTHPALLVRVLEMMLLTEIDNYQYGRFLENGLSDLSIHFPDDPECRRIE